MFWPRKRTGEGRCLLLWPLKVSINVVILGAKIWFVKKIEGRRRRRRWVGAKIPRCSFTGTSTQLGVQMTNDVQLTKASSSTTSIVKGSFFPLLTMALWFEESYRNWLMISELATNFTIWWFPPFKNKNRLFALFLSRCYWTWMVDIIFAYCI